ncbi:DUF2238 domain-containing protein [Dokdonella sp. MW10]|uniref:DUF2238 domain-containing protein n=1 Tax=Dokdonella sp. MW10 TaxID=2992926 RepID=UPI003F80EA3E
MSTAAFALPQPASRATLPFTLLAIFAIVLVALGLSPAIREDWLLENALVVVALAWLAWGWRHQRLSNGAYVLLFAFALFHEVGAHYQYSDVPYDAWFAAVSGGRSLDAMLGFERNHYDRLVHFLYGLLLTPVAAEVILRRVAMPPAWRFVLPVTFMMSHALVYELVEWAAASVFSEGLGEAYLGTQGDTWDAQKDMALATLGSLIVHPLWLWRRGHATGGRGRR